jgi:diguanylate cyclase (GGDEF)-like protein
VYQIAEDWFMRKNGSLFPVSYATSPLFENGNVTGAITVFRDISKQKADQERIEYLAFHDELTNLPNLRYINEKLTEDLHTNIPFALLVLDIDRFKHINVALGHAFGDLILQLVACRLKEQLPSQVFVGRLTGDEFAIVFPGLNQGRCLALRVQTNSTSNQPTFASKASPLKRIGNHRLRYVSLPRKRRR